MKTSSVSVPLDFIEILENKSVQFSGCLRLSDRFFSDSLLEKDSYGSVTNNLVMCCIVGIILLYIGIIISLYKDPG